MKGNANLEYQDRAIADNHHSQYTDKLRYFKNIYGTVCPPKRLPLWAGKLQYHPLEFECFKGKWQQNFLSSYLKETPKQYIEVYYRIFISALFGEIFGLEIFSCPRFWIFVDMHDTSQLGSRNFFFLRHND